MFTFTPLSPEVAIAIGSWLAPWPAIFRVAPVDIGPESLLRRGSLPERIAMSVPGLVVVLAPAASDD